MKFRVKEVKGVGYFPQVKYTFKDFDNLLDAIYSHEWPSWWQRIGRHPNGEYGLYNECDESYPESSFSEAMAVCKAYKEKCSKITNEYSYIKL